MAKILNSGFHHIAFKCKDLDKTVKFYTEGLGLEKNIEWGEGDSRGIMIDMGDGGFIELFAGGSGQAPNGAYIHFAFATDDVDGAYAAALAAGATTHTAPNDVDIPTNPATKIRIAFVKGLDGEEIEFFAYRK